MNLEAAIALLAQAEVFVRFEPDGLVMIDGRVSTAELDAIHWIQAHRTEFEVARYIQSSRE